MNEDEPNNRFDSAKSQSRGIDCDMSSDAVIRRLEIVDELRELAKELQAAKRIGTVDVHGQQACQLGSSMTSICLASLVVLLLEYRDRHALEVFRESRVGRVRGKN